MINSTVRIDFLVCYSLILFKIRHHGTPHKNDIHDDILEALKTFVATNVVTNVVTNVATITVSLFVVSMLKQLLVY